VRKQFVLDKRSDKLLEELAAYRGGNRSLVIRQAIQVYADMEERLDTIEGDPQFRLRMSRARSRRRTKRRS
jgi:hypothetical protein